MVRMLPRFVAGFAAVITLSLCTSLPAAAQEQLASAALTAPTGLVPSTTRTSALFPASPAPSQIAAPGIGRVEASTIDAPDFSRLRRPALLPALYATTVALQALDAHSTMTALDRGAREANPLMKGVVGHGGAMLAVKAGAAAGTIYFAEKLWRRNRVAAVALMVAVNGVTAAVVAHNYNVASRMQR
jgi:hypothetical protein